MECGDVLTEAGAVATAATSVALRAALGRYETARRGWQHALWHEPRTSPASWAAQRALDSAFVDLAACWALHVGGVATAP